MLLKAPLLSVWRAIEGIIPTGRGMSEVFTRACVICCWSTHADGIKEVKWSRLLPGRVGKMSDGSPKGQSPSVVKIRLWKTPLQWVWTNCVCCVDVWYLPHLIYGVIHYMLKKKGFKCSIPVTPFATRSYLNCSRRSIILIKKTMISSLVLNYLNIILHKHYTWSLMP